MSLLGIMKIEVIGAKGVPRRWMRQRRDFVVISLGQQTFRTGVAVDQSRQNWNQVSVWAGVCVCVCRMCTCVLSVPHVCFCARAFAFTACAHVV